MLNTIYLLSIILGVSGQNIVQKIYAGKTKGKGVYVFGMITSICAMLFFLLTSKDIALNVEVLPYAVGFAISYAVATASLVMAVSCGSLSLTSLIVSYSLLLPTVYGLLFLKDPISIGFIPGIILLIISLVLINKKDEKVKFSLKWIICVILAFVGNGMCSVIQKMQQVRFDGAYKNELMIEALIIVTTILLVLSFAKERKDTKTFVKHGWYLGLICGLLNSMVNLFVMILSGRIPVSLMFPLISAGGIIVIYIVSRFIYKETLTKLQFVGFILGIISVVLLNI